MRRKSSWEKGRHGERKGKQREKKGMKFGRKRSKNLFGREINWGIWKRKGKGREKTREKKCKKEGN